MANASAIYRTMDNITDDNLDMDQWGRRGGCRTTMCFAGHAVVAAGHALRWEKVDDLGSGTFVAIYTTEGDSVENLAQEILELDHDETYSLFFADDVETKAELWRTIEEVTGILQPPTQASAA